MDTLNIRNGQVSRARRGRTLVLRKDATAWITRRFVNHSAQLQEPPHPQSLP